MRTLLFLLITSSAFSQNITDWETTPKPYIDTNNFSGEDAVILTQYNQVDFEDLQYRFITHTRTLVLSETGIEKNNKFYYYKEKGKTLSVLKARVITPSGKVIDIPKDRILDSRNEYNRVEYKYFAFEGVEVGSILEVFTKEVCTPASGIIEDLFTINAEFPIQNYTTVFSTRVSFQVNYEMTINQELYKTETTEEDRIRNIIISGKNIPKYIEETYAYETDYKGYIYYQIGGKDDPALNGILNRYQNSFTEITNQTISEKRMTALFDEFITTPCNTDMEKLYAIENLIKGPGLTVESNLVKIPRLGQSTYTEDQQLKLIYQYAKLYNLNPTIILTGDCDRLKITKSVCPPFLFSELFIYFPISGEVYSPSNLSRIHLVSKDFLGNKYLNVSANRLTEFDIPKPEFSIDSIHITLRPNFIELQDSIVANRTTSGHFCESFQSEYAERSVENKQSAMNYFIHYHLPECTIYDSTVLNDSYIHLMKLPIIGKFKATSTDDIIQADGSYLLDIGKYIGKQISMHNEVSNRRVSPIRTYNPHIYKREFEIIIPEGYKISNLEDLMINTSDNARKLGLSFESSYELDGNKLMISISERYNELSYFNFDYKEFLEVMNAASDFNAIQLIFEMK